MWSSSRHNAKGQVVQSGHTGIVGEVEAKTSNYRLIHASGGNRRSGINKWFIPSSKYALETFIGFYHPVKETPDGKLDGQKQVASGQQPAASSTENPNHDNANSSGNVSSSDAQSDKNEALSLLREMNAFQLASPAEQKAMTNNMLELMHGDQSHKK